MNIPSKSIVYLDNAATSPVDPEVKREIKQFINRSLIANPSSRHREGVEMSNLILSKKKQISSLLGIPVSSFDETNIIFTSGATESNNLIIQGYVKKNCKKGKYHILLGPTEHDCVRNCVMSVCEEFSTPLVSFEYEEIPLLPNGSIDLNSFRNMIKPTTIMVCQMLVSNVFGTIYEVQEMAKIINEKMKEFSSNNILLHVDVAQAIGKFPFKITDFSSYVRTSFTLSGHKFNSIKGIGCLLYDDGTEMTTNSPSHSRLTEVCEPLFFGGGQESGLRSGTENILGIISISKAISVNLNDIQNSMRLYKSLYDKVVEMIKSSNLTEKQAILVEEQKSCYSILSMLTPSVPSEVVFNHMIKSKVFVSVGSACQAREQKLSPGIGHRLGNKELSKHLIRLSFSRFTTIEEVERGMKVFARIVKKLCPNEEEENEKEKMQNEEGEEEKRKENRLVGRKRKKDEWMKQQGKSVGNEKEKKKKKTNKRKFDSGTEYSRILCRVGELALKKKNRKQFERTLASNIASVCKEICPCNLDNRDRRIYITPQKESDYYLVPRLAQRIRQVFGLVNISLCLKVESKYETILKSCLFLCEKKLSEFKKEKVRTEENILFKVNTKRANKRFGMISMDVSRQIGAEIIKLSPLFKVQLKNPSFEVGVDIRTEATYIFTSKLPCAGGLPVGSTGKGITLLSGGIDSPVAAWLIMKRGVKMNFLSFYSFPYTSEKLITKIKKLVQQIAKYQPNGGKLYLVPFTKVQEAVRDHAPEPYRTVIYRRTMNRIAVLISNNNGGKCVVTGESLGQVASQTMNNITTIREPLGNLPVFRPLIGMDKSEIIKIAEDIGTYEISNIEESDTCTLFKPKSPIIHSKLEETLKGEELIPGFSELIERVVKEATVVDVSTDMFKEEREKMMDEEELEDDEDESKEPPYKKRKLNN